MSDEPMELTILTYHSNVVEADAEVYRLWHGAEHRANDLIVEWGDVPNWVTKNVGGVVTATNNSLGAEIVLRKRELNESGHES